MVDLTGFSWNQIFQQLKKLSDLRPTFIANLEEATKHA